MGMWEPGAMASGSGGCLAERVVVLGFEGSLLVEGEEA